MRKRAHKKFWVSQFSCSKSYITTNMMCYLYRVRETTNKGPFDLSKSWTRNNRVYNELIKYQKLLVANIQNASKLYSVTNPRLHHHFLFFVSSFSSLLWWFSCHPNLVNKMDRRSWSLQTCKISIMKVKFRAAPRSSQKRRKYHHCCFWIPGVS